MRMTSRPCGISISIVTYLSALRVVATCAIEEHPLTSIAGGPAPGRDGDLAEPSFIRSGLSKRSCLNDPMCRLFRTYLATGRNERLANSENAFSTRRWRSE